MKGLPLNRWLYELPCRVSCLALFCEEVDRGNNDTGCPNMWPHLDRRQFRCNFGGRFVSGMQEFHVLSHGG